MSRSSSTNSLNLASWGSSPFSMTTAGTSGDCNKDGNLEVAVQYSGPAVLPWLWQPVEHDGEIVLLPQAIPHVAGKSGMVQPHASHHLALQRSTIPV